VEARGHCIAVFICIQIPNIVDLNLVIFTFQAVLILIQVLLYNKNATPLMATRTILYSNIRDLFHHLKMI
jgi:hypothetical protein